MTDKEKLQSLQESIRILKQFSSPEEQKVLDEITPKNLEEKDKIVEDKTLAKITYLKKQRDLK